MQDSQSFWDFLILTASNEQQAESYRHQLDLRFRLGLIPAVNEVLVVPDPEGRRIGSGGSTIYCLIRMLNHLKAENWEQELSRNRVLIVHAGGDSRRLPSYSACGKLFVPVPGESDHIFGNTLFDRQLPLYLRLPPLEKGRGQIVVTTGDVYLEFDPSHLTFQPQGITAVGCPAPPDLAKNHGVFCAGKNGRVREFLQKPAYKKQRELGAVNRFGMSTLDIGVWSLSPESAVRWLKLSGLHRTDSSEWKWKGEMVDKILSYGLDLFLEIGCAMGEESDFQKYVSNLSEAGSRWSGESLKHLFEVFSKEEFFLQNVSRCEFLHFGSPRQLIESGREMRKYNHIFSAPESVLTINSIIDKQGSLVGKNAWVEGCRISSQVKLMGDNLLVGADVVSPLTLVPRCCVDILAGRDSSGKKIWFVRVFGIDDTFKKTGGKAEFCGLSIQNWLQDMDASESDIWMKPGEKSYWNAKFFPSIEDPALFTEWLWMFKPGKATENQKKAWKKANRFSLKEILELADLSGFFFRRLDHRLQELWKRRRWIFRKDSRFSADELAYILSLLRDKERETWIHGILVEARRQWEAEEEVWGMERLEFSRTIHSLAAALKKVRQKGSEGWNSTIRRISEHMAPELKSWLVTLNLEIGPDTGISEWSERAVNAAFVNLSRTIVLSKKKSRSFPKKAVRSDEIVWGRAPARLDLGGGWTDTPPYALEHGGCVINAAVDLNGQPPIQVYARLTQEEKIRIASIDHGVDLEIRKLDDLMDYREASSKFGLAKAALSLAGFSLEGTDWPEETKTLEDMLHHFGGGIELTTLAAIPSGSGLGTSSIMGAVLVSVIARLTGESLSERDLFHRVLQLEQELTTGGGWQDQIGGTLPGLKVISTDPGLYPDPKIKYVPGDLLDPRTNGGRTLLYYTGMRRLAKNILRNVVGRYLNRDPRAMHILTELHEYPPKAADALSRHDLPEFGRLISYAKLLNQIDPGSTNPAIEEIINRFRPYMHGAKLLGAGGGGFLLVVCRSVETARQARLDLEKNPPNPLARFFEFRLSSKGLELTVC